MTGNNYVYKRTNGGPSLLYVNPVEQSINKISLSTPNNKDITNNFINLVIKTKDASKIKLDGHTSFAKFTPIDDTYSAGYASQSGDLPGAHAAVAFENQHLAFGEGQVHQLI